MNTMTTSSILPTVDFLQRHGVVGLAAGVGYAFGVL
jgi:hypothetical protein